jgi:hypothetical protein
MSHSNTSTVTGSSIYSSFGAANNNAWLGSPNGSGNAYNVNSNGNVNNNDTSNDYVLAPAFMISSEVRF